MTGWQGHIGCLFQLKLVSGSGRLDSLAAELSYTRLVYAAILVNAIFGACLGYGVAAPIPDTSTGV